ncbi:AAA family ATPase [Glycocaulis abyssi]|uniref:AAA family ATPase n=1 Tax=Glycocaulis abyssi TaxID=1433403 RepID=A0ABV9NF19_9PROT
MLNSKAEGDDEQFYSIALQIAASEARQGRRTSADALRKAVDAARSRLGAPVPIQFAQPRGDLEGLIELKEPRYILKDVVLDAQLRLRLDDVVKEQAKRDWLREHGKRPARRVLFVGPPGSGKTMTAEALAGQLKLPLFVIRLEALITRFMGETAAKLRLVFDETQKRRGVYLFDEFDAVGGKRNATNDVAEMRRVLNSFLQYMEEESVTDSLIVGATNHPELLDRALIRRFDTILSFQLPSDEEVKRVLLAGMRPLKHGRLSWTKVLEAAQGLSQAELSKAAEDAVKSAILDERDTITTDQLLRRLSERRSMQEAFKNPESR